MPTEKFYCGNCGSPLYYGRKFKEHTLGRSCPKCQTLNPAYFHYCYRCGEKILPSEETQEETV
jgi:DNA-directed RNA polymerase subunit RPC12/RpoP